MAKPDLVMAFSILRIPWAVLKPQGPPTKRTVLGIETLGSRRARRRWAIQEELRRAILDASESVIRGREDGAEEPEGAAATPAGGAAARGTDGSARAAQAAGGCGDGTE